MTGAAEHAGIKTEAAGQEIIMENEKNTDISDIFDRVRGESPLIHCITHPIVSNDCANILLAMGARPIMAEHPDEAAGVTETAKALSVSLGNITPHRLEAIQNSGRAARHYNIPCVMDLVGVACSQIRQEFAKKFILENRPAVIKGNATEIKAMALNTLYKEGVDARVQDKATLDGTGGEVAALAKKLGRDCHCIVVVSGETDIITDGSGMAAVENGCPMMAKITGTGCMLNVITAACMAVSGSDYFSACVSAVSGFGVAAQLAEQELNGSKVHWGSGSFHIALIDSMYHMDGAALNKYGKINFL